MERDRLPFLRLRGVRDEVRTACGRRGRHAVERGERRRAGGGRVVEGPAGVGPGERHPGEQRAEGERLHHRVPDAERERAAVLVEREPELAGVEHHAFVGAKLARQRDGRPGAVLDRPRFQIDRRVAVVPELEPIPPCVVDGIAHELGDQHGRRGGRRRRGVRVVGRRHRVGVHDGQVRRKVTAISNRRSNRWTTRCIARRTGSHIPPHSSRIIRAVR